MLKAYRVAFVASVFRCSACASYRLVSGPGGEGEQGTGTLGRELDGDASQSHTGQIPGRVGTMDADQTGDSGRPGYSVCKRLRDMYLIYMGEFILGKAIKSTLICKEVTNVIFRA